ncbi:MAG: hypothetical protein GYA16_15135 [Spirochaetes bacterium]|nr:hypothetical protein [Spirochaetota bacterium]
MLTMKLIKKTEDNVTYEYYPENNKDFPGLIGLNLKTNERQFIKDSSEDFDKWYASHAIERIEKYNKSGKFLEYDKVAWY